MSTAAYVVRLAALLAPAVWALQAQPCQAEVADGHVIACGSASGFDTNTIGQRLPEQARGQVLLVAEHQQVMIIEADIDYDLQPLVVVSRNAGGYFVTTERDHGRKPVVSTAPLPEDLAAKIAAAFPRALAEASIEPDDQVGWQVQSAPGKCVLVVHDMFRTVLGGGPSHWVVAMVDGLIKLAEARGKRARGKAESAIRAAIPD